MASISALHTTIAFPSDLEEHGASRGCQWPELHRCTPLWRDRSTHRAEWVTAITAHPALVPLLEHVTCALETERVFWRRYREARLFFRGGTILLVTHWTTLSIDALISTTQRWMDVGRMLAEVERDVPGLAGVVQAVLMRVGQEQHRLLTMLAVLQAFHFAFCSQCGVSAVLHPASAEEEEEDSEAEDQARAQRLPQVTLSPTDQIEVREVFG